MIKLGKKTTATLLTAMIILSMTPIQANAAQMQFFFGDVTINGSPAPSGTLVEAKIAGVLRDSELTIGKVFGYQQDFWVDNAEIGDIIDFYVGGVLALCYNLKAFKQTIEVHLSIPPTSTLSIDTTPVKGVVSVDGIPWGTAPQSQDVGVGTYTISFGDVAGYTTPDSQTITILTGEFSSVTGVYDLITGTLSIDTNPMKGEVFVDGGPWGTAPQSQDVAVGTYTISFGDVAGYTTPSDEEAVVTEDTTTTITGTYVLIQPSSLYPVIVTLSTGETVYIASHTSDLADGNWIELSGGTSIQLPSLTIAYEGLDSATYEGDVADVTIESSFAAGGATYPLATHQVYSNGQSITATFRGASSMWGPVDFRLISISSIAEARDILTSAFQGDLAPFISNLTGATWSDLSVGLDGVGDATVVIPPKSVGNYLLVVVKQNADDIWIDSATIIEVLEQTLDVTCPSSVQRGASLNVNTGLTGIHGAILIKETAYSGEVKLITAGTVLSTELRLNGVLMADGAFVIDTPSLSLEDVGLLLGQLKKAFGSNQFAYGINPFTGSMSIPTSPLTTGDYILLVGVYNFADSRIVGVYQKTVQVTSPPPAPSVNRLPVAEAGPHQIAWIDRTVYFDGSDSHDPDGYLISWDWSFGDGATAHEETVTHEYSEPGNYLVTLTVKDSRLAVVSDTCVVEISEPPAPVSDEYAERVAAGEEGHVVDASDEANTTVTLTTTDPVTVTVLKYEGNPYPEDPIPANALPNYVDVQVSNPDAVTWPIYVETSYTDEEIGELDESTFGIYYWMDEAWQRCSNTGVNTMKNIVWAYMTAGEAAGSPILIGGMPAIEPPPLPPFLSDLTVTPSELEQGDDVTISLDIMNPNNQSITYIVTMRIGELTLLVDVELEAYESKTVSRTLTMGMVGDYSVTVDGMTGSFVVGPPLIPVEPAEFVVSELEIQPAEVEEGEAVTFSVFVENIGETEGSYIVEFRVDGEIVDTQIVTVPAAFGRQAMAYYEAPSAGTYQVSVEDLTETLKVLALLEPAEFEVSDLVLIPSEIETGGTVIVSAMIANVGEMGGGYTVELKVDGETVDTESVTLAGGTSQDISFTISSEEEGEHTIEVDGLSDSFTVKAVTPPTKFPWIWIVLVFIVAAAVYLIWTQTDWIQQLLNRIR